VYIYVDIQYAYMYVYVYYVYIQIYLRILSSISYIGDVDILDEKIMRSGAPMSGSCTGDSSDGGGVKQEVIDEVIHTHKYTYLYICVYMYESIYIYTYICICICRIILKGPKEFGPGPGEKGRK
jgi:hypothetical protein